MHVDNQAIKRITIKFGVVIPWLDDLLDGLSISKLLSTLDLRNGCHQMQIKLWMENITQDKRKIIWAACHAIWIVQSAEYLHEIMNQVLKPFIVKFMVQYFDDI